MIRNLAAAAAMALATTAFGASGAAADSDTVLQKIKDAGTMRVCSAAYAPWNIKNPTNNVWEGIVPDIVNEIATALEVEVEWVDVSWSTVIASVETGKCDLVGSALWTAPQRAEVISFTRPIGGDGMSIFVPSGMNATSLEDIDVAGKVVAVASGSADERVAKALFKNAEVKSIVSDRANSAVMEVAAGRADAASAGFAGTAQMLKANSNLKVKPVEGMMFNFTPFAFAVPAKEYFFRDYVNVVLGNLDASGRLKEIKDAWTKVE